MKSDLIKNIDILDDSSWKNKIFISTDIDWACDGVINYCIDFFSKLDVKVTWFATHKTPCNLEIEKNELFDLGAHPNFNFLLNGEGTRSIKGVLSDLETCIPKGSVIRSHSTTQNSPILDLIHEHNYTHESNMFIPVTAPIEVKPFNHFNGVVRVPYIWSDDVHLAYRWDYLAILEDLKKYKGLVVIDCHPIHIFLNTSEPKQYTAARPYLQNFEKLSDYVNSNDYGTQDFLVDLISKIQ